MLENGMVLGDYYDEVTPDCTCEHCGKGWNEDKWAGGWESCEYRSTKAYGFPLHGHYCEACIMDASTPERAAAWVAMKEQEDNEKFHTSRQIKSCVLPQVILYCMGADDTAMESRGYLDAYSCKWMFDKLVEDGGEEIEEAVQELYPEEYAEFLEEVEDGWHKEVK